MIIGGRWLLSNVVAVQWSDALAAEFPDADHAGCYQSHKWVPELGRFEPFVPALCHDWHCPRCGRACNSMGHHECEAA